MKMDDEMRGRGRMIRDDKDSKEREQVRCQEMRRNKGNMRSKKQRGEQKDGKR